MDRSSKLIPNSIIEQCNSAILMLTQDNDRLTDVAQNIDAFVNDTSIKSTAFDALKNQMTNFDTAIGLMMMANDSDIEAYTRLSGMVGSEELIGSELFDQLEEAERSKKASEEKIEHYKNLVLSAPSSTAVSGYNTTVMTNYKNLISADEEIIRKIKEKMELYDQIESQSKGLFSTGESLRSQAMSVIQEISASYVSGGSYVTADCSAVNDSVVKGLSALGIAVGGATAATQGTSSPSVEYNKTSFKDSYKTEVDWKKQKVYFKYKSEYRYSAIYSGTSYDGEYVDAKGSLAAGKVDVDTTGKAILWNEDGKFDPTLEGEVKAEASWLEARGDVKIGTEDIYSKTEVEGDVGVVSAKGKIEFAKDEDGSGYDIGGEAKLGASLFSGEIKQKFNVFGYELEISAEGQAVGLGAEAKAVYDSGSFEAKLGATAGVGGTVGIKFGKALPSEEEILGSFTN